LILHEFGGSGGGEWGETERSLIQISTFDSDWSESSLNWNNAPLARQNVSRAWVSPMTGALTWPGVPYRWDVTAAVKDALTAGQPLRLAAYSADTEYHSGKYFVSSDTGDWNAEGRPTLKISLGPKS
jgi:hypothetical protein